MSDMPDFAVGHCKGRYLHFCEGSWLYIGGSGGNISQEAEARNRKEQQRSCYPAESIGAALIGSSWELHFGSLMSEN